MLSIPLFRAVSSRSTLFSSPTAVQIASHFHVVARRNSEIARAKEPTHDDTDIAGRAQAASNNGLSQITNILDNAVLSQSLRSANFSRKLFVVSASQVFLNQCSWRP